MQEEEFIYRIEFGVRDYECDLQGVVNNANYLHYLEHARHEYLASKGVSFSRLHDEGTELIITRVEVDYKYPLRSCDRFIVTLNIMREGHIRIVFFQNIYRIPDNKLIVKAKITSAATKNGKPFVPADLIQKLGIK